jgi:hypothetical protein
MVGLPYLRFFEYFPKNSAKTVDESTLLWDNVGVDKENGPAGAETPRSPDSLLRRPP